MAQKEQRAVVKKFRSGDYNVLVATSIGEEGLDIGEVGLSPFCPMHLAPLTPYSTQPSPFTPPLTPDPLVHGSPTGGPDHLL